MARRKIPLRLAQLALAGLALVAMNSFAASVNDVRVWDSPERTRVVFDLSKPIKYKIFSLDNPHRVVVDIAKSNFIGQLPDESKLGERVLRIRTGARGDGTRFVLDLGSKMRSKHFTLKPIKSYGDRLVVDIYSESKPKQAIKPRSADDKLVVVIDAGHGGEDPGAVGAKKTLEKELVLKIAKYLKKELDAVPGIRAELTRKGDYYIPLRKRTKVATDLNADLFVSIHADAFTRRSAHGISVFALSTRGATSERARVLANKENAADVVAGENLSHKEPDVAEVLAGLSFDAKIDRSISLGSMVRMRLSRVGRLHGNDVERAGFVVLKAPSIPSILVEVGFISNPAEERKLRTRAYQKKIAKEIKTGIVEYAKKHPWGQEKWRSASSQ